MVKVYHFMYGAEKRHCWLQQEHVWVSAELGHCCLLIYDCCYKEQGEFWAIQPTCSAQIQPNAANAPQMSNDAKPQGQTETVSGYSSVAHKATLLMAEDKPKNKKTRKRAAATAVTAGRDASRKEHLW